MTSRRSRSSGSRPRSSGSGSDRDLLVLLRTRGHQPGIERAVKALSKTGEHGLLWYGLAGAGALLDAERRPAYRRAAATTLASYVLNQGIKFVVRRRRPELPGLPPLIPTTLKLSYPSAHSTMSFAAARSLARVWPAPPLYALACVMALSRPYLGVHYPSDVVAGAALGTAVAS